MVKWIKEKEIRSFMQFIPEDMRPDVVRGDYFCLGAMEEGEERNTPTGVLVFSPEEGITGDDELSGIIEIHWIYVAEDYRRQGYANELMQALADAAEDNPADGIVCDVPFDSRYDLAEAFFVSWGFDFEVIGSSELLLDKEDCAGLITRQFGSIEKGEAKPEDISLLRDLTDKEFAEALREVKQAEKAAYYDNVPDNRYFYDADLSCAVLYGSKASSLLLIGRDGMEELHVMMAGTTLRDGTEVLMEMFCYAAAFYLLHYPDFTRLRITMGTDRLIDLAEKLFPDKEPDLIRRGYFR